jgi:hypothetical protein
MKIKKYPNGNQYLMTQSGMWVRNFTLQNVPLLDVNNTINSEDHFLFVTNEFENGMKRYMWIDTEKFYFPNVIIVSDGFNFKEKHSIISKIKDIGNVTVIGVNGSLKKWTCERGMSFYLTNNPYEECLGDLPRRRMLPRCIASCRTNSKFLENYNGTIFRYNPVGEKSYSGTGAKEAIWSIDDYRNPVCAAIGLAYKFGVEKLLLMFCDESFKEERPGAKMLENGLWTYPQQIKAQEVIDANLHWLKSEEYRDVKTGSFSDGLIYNSAAYINEEEVLEFFA